jgi:hypothetical protein
LFLLIRLCLPFLPFSILNLSLCASFASSDILSRCLRFFSADGLQGFMKPRMMKELYFVSSMINLVSVIINSCEIKHDQAMDTKFKQKRQPRNEFWIIF